MTSLTSHLPFKGQGICLHLHILRSGVTSLIFNLLLLKPAIVLLIFGMHEGDTLIVFLLRILWRGWVLGKQEVTRSRNSDPILVFILLQYGGLNQITLRDLDFFFCDLLGSKIKSTSYPLFLRQSSKKPFSLLNTSSEELRSLTLLCTVKGICLMT